MRTSLNEIRLIEDHLDKRLDGAEETLFQAKLLLDKRLDAEVQAQFQTYRLVKAYGRSSLKRDLDAVHKKLFTEAEHRNFRFKILSIFGLK